MFKILTCSKLCIDDLDHPDDPLINDDDHYFENHLHFHDPFSASQPDLSHLHKLSDIIPPHFGSIYSLSQLDAIDTNHIDASDQDIDTLIMEDFIENFPGVRLNEREDGYEVDLVDVALPFGAGGAGGGGSKNGGIERVKKSTPSSDVNGGWVAVSVPYTGVTPPGICETYLLIKFMLGLRLSLDFREFKQR